MNIYEKLLIIQSKLKAPKSQYNAFGKYHYRNCEDILEALKSLEAETKTVVLITDELVHIGDRHYVKSTASLVDTESADIVFVTAYAREEENKKGMDGSQVTGAASSYARKYALNGLFGIDDNKDSDNTNKGDKAPTTPDKPAEPTKEYKCVDCGKPFADFKDRDGKTWTAGQVYHMAESKNTDKKARCNACRLKHEKETTNNG